MSCEDHFAQLALIKEFSAGAARRWLNKQKPLRLSLGLEYPLY